MEMPCLRIKNTSEPFLNRLNFNDHDTCNDVGVSGLVVMVKVPIVLDTHT